MKRKIYKFKCKRKVEEMQLLLKIGSTPYCTLYSLTNLVPLWETVQLYEGLQLNFLCRKFGGTFCVAGHTVNFLYEDTGAH